MGQVAAMRATSFAASAALLAAIALAALTMTITLRERGEVPSIPTVTLERPPEPPIQRPRDPPRQLPRLADPDVLPLLPQPAPSASDLAAVSAPYAPSVPSLVTITNPEWVRRPSNLQSYYPRRPLTRGVEGDVFLNCRVSAAGVLDCAIASEAPAGWGFGDAALRIARDHRMVPAMRDGAAVEGRYVMLIPFRIE